MEWILDHLQFVIAAIIIVGYLLRGLRKTGDDEAPAPDRRRQPDSDPGEAERTRRIQEEIRRRILERQRGAPAEPRPVLVFEREEEPPALRPDYRAPAPPPIPTRMEPDPAMAAVLERQRALQEQLQAIRAARPADSPARRGARLRSSVSASRPGDGALRELKRDLTGAQALRKAILLREILGEPVGLRPGFPELPKR